MKMALYLVIIAALAFIIIACNGKNSKTVDENDSEIAVVQGEAEPEDDTFPKMEIDVRGLIFTINPGEGVVGHYDKEKEYWVCTEDEPIFETSPNTYGNIKYTVLTIRDRSETGLLNENGAIVVLPMYSSIDLGFTNGFCKVKNKDGKYGLIAEDGRVALPTVYDDIWHHDIIDGLIKVSQNDLQGFLNLQGETVIPLEYVVVEQAGEGLIWFTHQPEQWGCINYKNEVIVKPEFTNIAPFIDGKATSQKSDAENYFIYTDGRVVKCN